MKDHRSASQILFGFLPAQTVDLRGGVWKVKQWRRPLRESNIASSSLVRELKRLAAPWRVHGTDGNFVQDLERGYEVHVYSLDRENGVEVEPFPELWMCKSCNRLSSNPEKRCKCGSQGCTGQLPFVAYHDACGAIKTPYIPRCRTHNDVRVELPGTASAAEIRFVCPECQVVLRTGFGFPRCNCGQGQMTFNVHRAASVFTPHNVVIVNPPSRDKMQRITGAGGPARALSWVVGGMGSMSIEDSPTTAESLRQQLVNQGLPEEVVNRMIEAAASSGAVAEAEGAIALPQELSEEAESQAVTIALGVSGSRKRIVDLQDGTDGLSELGVLYRDRYPVALKSSGLCGVDLVDRFPVLTGHFGYSRGGQDPEQARLVTYREAGGEYRVYGDVAETEALFIRLDPTQVLRWLILKGHNLNNCESPETARAEILRNARIPPNGNENPQSSVGADLLTLVHSYSHRFIRTAAVFSGIDRNALSELLVPLHLGFFAFAVPRGNFVLGGLQAVFESDLDALLDAVVKGEHRCALDPGCRRGGAACMACLHLGEPSCRFFNRFLNRDFLVGSNGYLTLSQ